MLHAGTKSEGHVVVQAEGLAADVWLEGLEVPIDPIMTDVTEFGTTYKVTESELCRDLRE